MYHVGFRVAVVRVTEMVGYVKVEGQEDNVNRPSGAPGITS
jgi:hypothetical protein